METTAAFDGLACADCGATVPPETPGRCPDCGGALDVTYDVDAAAVDAEALTRARTAWDATPLLPFPAEAGVSLGEGGTPLVECPGVAEELGVARVLVKDEGRNPTGSAADRGATLAVSAARAAGATGVALATPGPAGRAVAAYAGRAGLDATVFVPSRADFATKAMVNVHGAEMSVVGGRLPDATAAYRDAAVDADWHPVGAVDSPYVVEGLKTLFCEVAAAEDWTVPDAVVHPTGTGTGLAATHRAARELRDLGLTDDLPRCYAAQADGCAPVVRAVEDGEPVESWDAPDTIAGAVEVPDPAAGDRAADACRETGGGAVAVPDPALLESAVRTTAAEGVEVGVAGGVAAAGAWELAEQGAFDADDTVVLVNTSGSGADADVLRSHLMGQGV